MKKRVLIVDDAPNIRLNYRLALEIEGMQVDEAHCGSAALARLAEHSFDVAILDMRMPDMTGLELLAAMRDIGLLTPVIFITAYGDILEAVQAMKLGAIDFLEKPLAPVALRQAVSEVAARHSDRPALSKEASFEIHARAAKQLINLRNFRGAKDHIEKALQIKSDAPDIYNLGGVLFETLQDYDRARRYYAQALHLDKNHEAARQNLRRIYDLFQFGSSTESARLGNDPGSSPTRTC